MSKSIPSRLSGMVEALSRNARQRGLTDSEWARRANVRKETLSRLRRRQTCDLETLDALAQVVGAQVAVVGAHPADATPDGHFPQNLSRDYEDVLVDLCVSGSLNTSRWAAAGPRFFVAGLAVMLASVRDRDRRGLLALAEELHPGASEVAVFDRWLERSPVRPSRFLPMLDNREAHAP